MSNRVFIILGGTLWRRSDGDWLREAGASVPGCAADPITRLCEIIRTEPPDPVSVVYEPTGMTHLAVETPNADRRTFASVARIREEHPVVVSEQLAWSIERPWPASGGTFWTLLHGESEPGLSEIHATCSVRRIPLDAWPAYTVVNAALASSAGGLSVQGMVLVAPGFLAGIRVGSKPAFKCWTVPPSERELVDLDAFASETGFAGLAGTQPSARGRPRLAVFDGGESGLLGVIERRFTASAVFVARLQWDDLARAVASLRNSHPANLARSFPRTFSISRLCAQVATAGLCAGSFFAGAAMLAQKQDSLRAASDNLEEGRLARQSAELDANRREIAAFGASVGMDSQPGLPGAYGVLKALALAIPPALVLTSLELRRDGSFALEGRTGADRPDPAAIAASFEAAGLITAPVDGIRFDPSTERFRIRGSLTARSP